jgi:hypothetical protein
LEEIGTLERYAQPALKRGLWCYVARAEKHSGTQSEAFREALELATRFEGLNRNNVGFTLNFISEVYDIVPFESWDALQQSGSLDSDPEFARKLAKQMASRDPKRALDTLLEDEHPHAVQIESAFSEWLKLDVTAASAWYEGELPQLPPTVRDGASSAFVSNAVAHAELDTARQWADQIQDAQLKKKAEGQVWQAELGQVREEARQAPQQTIEAIVSGESQHATYWLETVMGEWMTKNAANATEWFETNRGALTPEQREPLTMAYARKAIKDGDLDTAAQWASQVSTDKNRERITKLLAEARQKGAP